MQQREMKVGHYQIGGWFYYGSVDWVEGTLAVDFLGSWQKRWLEFGCIGAESNEKVDEPCWC